MSRKTEIKLIDGIPHKKCASCSILKSLLEYGGNKSRPDGKNIYCKLCVGLATEKKRREPEYLSRKRAEYQRNKSRYQTSMLEYRKKNKDFIKTLNKSYYSVPENKERINQQRRHRYLSNINFRLIALFRSRFAIVPHQMKADKFGSSLKYLGCSIGDLRQHLEKQFVLGMSWENHGKGPGKWNIDHIKPCAAFDLSRENELSQCFHYTNLQPLWSEENLSKGDKYPMDMV
jgi:hypothetical protein